MDDALALFEHHTELEQALLSLKEYEDEWRENYRTTAVNFHVIGIQIIISDLSKEALEAGRLSVIEQMVAGLRDRARDRAPKRSS